jgi:hypothetical protein
VVDIKKVLLLITDINLGFAYIASNLIKKSAQPTGWSIAACENWRQTLE